MQITVFFAVANVMDKEKYNQSGYKDMTAFEAVQNVRREERRKLIAEIKALALSHGYIITGQINIKEITDDGK